MPLLTLTTSAPEPADKAAFIHRITELLSSTLGKPLQYCMVVLHFGTTMALGGSTDHSG